LVHFLRTRARNNVFQEHQYQGRDIPWLLVAFLWGASIWHIYNSGLSRENLTIYISILLLLPLTIDLLCLILKKPEMNKVTKLINLILILTLNFSCVENRTTEKTVSKPELVATSENETLKFTSGIRAILEDSKGNYWFGSHNEGVGYYDGRSFEYFSIQDGLADNQIRSIQEDENGIIWFETANGVSSWDGRTIKLHLVNRDSEAEWTKTDKDLWFNAGTQQGVYKYDGHEINYLAFPSPKDITTGNTYALTSFSKGKNGMLWFGTYAGVFGYNGIEFTTINDETLRLAEDSEQLHVRSILEDAQGRLWIGNNGIGVILKEGDSIIHFSKEQGILIPRGEFEANAQINRFAKNTGLQSVFAIAEDSQGNIWFGDRDSGAWKYDGKTLENYTIDSRLNSQLIWNIYEDHNKNILFGMGEGGVYKFNGETFDKQF
jgi:ligand-binding sensor domain-containing protein